MNHLKILGIKFIASSVIVLSLFGIFNNYNWGNLILISAFITVVSYLLVDMMLLRRFGNVISSIVDFGLAFASYWVLGSTLIGGESGPMLLISLTAAFFTMFVEGFIHIYIVSQFDEFKEVETYQPVNRLQTEFGEEMHAEADKATRKPFNRDDH